MHTTYPSLIRRIARPALAVISFLVVFASIGYWMLSFADKREKIDVVIAARDLDAPRALTADDVTVVTRPRADLSKTSIAQKDAVLGVTLVVPMSAGDVLTTNHVLREVDVRSESLFVATGMFGFSLPVDWLAGRPPNVAAHDSIQVIASVADKPVTTGTTIVGEHLRVLRVDHDSDGLPTRFLLEVRMIDAAHLLQARANRLALAVLVEPPVRAK